MFHNNCFVKLRRFHFVPTGVDLKFISPVIINVSQHISCFRCRIFSRRDFIDSELSRYGLFLVRCMCIRWETFDPVFQLGFLLCQCSYLGVLPLHVLMTRSRLLTLLRASTSHLLCLGHFVYDEFV